MNSRKFTPDMNPLILNIKYCIPEDVKKNRQQFLVYKSAFAQKQAHLKSLGQKLITTSKINAWIEDDIDILYPKLKYLVKDDKLND